MIKVKNATKIFGSAGESPTYANNDISFDVDKGEFVVLLGHSGSGKTTILNMLSTLEKPTSGDITYNDKSILNLKGKDLRNFRIEYVGLIFQEYHLIPMLTVLENVEIGSALVGESKESALKILEKVNLKGHEDKFPYQLSGGEQQRVAIARAVAKKPKVLFCDEPTGALDEKTGIMILKLLKELQKNENITIILITHNSSIAEIADKVIRLNSGKILSIEKNKNPKDVDKVAWE